MPIIKIVLGLCVLFVAWAFFSQSKLIYQINQWMREVVFNDQLALFSGRRVALLLFLLGGVALFSGIDNISDSRALTPAMVSKVMEMAQDDFNRGRYSHAIKRCRQILVADPNNLEAWEMVANSWFTLGEKEKTVQAIDAMVKINPKYVVTQQPLANFIDKDFLAKKK